MIPQVYASDVALMTPKALASAVMQAIFQYESIPEGDQARQTIPSLHLHFHDGAQSPIAWNDVQGIRYRNTYHGESIPIPLTATEGYHEHGHSGPFDGGWLPGRSNHDHRDNHHGGFAFAVYHPGTDLPQQNFGI